MSRKNKSFINLILNGEMNDEIKEMVEQIIINNKELLEFLSPELWAKEINQKIFIIHGANDSMVPFTESILLHNQIKDSTLILLEKGAI